MDDDMQQLHYVYDIISKIYERDDIPLIDTKDRVGPTGYVDYIDESEVTHSIMKGCDFMGRKIIVMQFIVDNKKCIQTFFQRYADYEEAVWMAACVRGHHFNLLNTLGGMTRYQAKLLLDISLCKIIKIEEDHKPVYINDESLIGKNVMLYDKNKIDAALTIQNYWSICRNNTMYKIARNYVTESYNKFIESINSS